MDLYKCRGCQVDKPLTSYRINKRRTNPCRLSSYCIPKCYKEKVTEPDKERSRLRSKKWRLNHKREQAEYFRKWKIDNLDHLRSTQSQYKKNNRDKYNIYEQKRYTTKLNADRGFTPEQWELLKQIYGHRCAYCGKKRKLTMDHVIPLSKGGLHHASNIVPACKTCNSVKRDREAPSYQPLLK